MTSTNARTRNGTMVVLAAAAVFLLACAGGTNVSPSPGATASPASTASPSGSPSPSATPSPTAAANAGVAIVRIEQTGGMMPPWETARWYPSFALYGDGRLITEGPQIELYPGPALPNLVVTHISERGVGQILQWAAEAGLRGEDRQLGPQILDSGETLFTVVTPGGTHRTGVTDMSASDPEIGALRQFVEVMQGLRSYLPDDIAGSDAPYEFDRLRIIAFPSDAQGLPDPNLANELDWPLAPIATLGTSFGEPAEYRCAVIEGNDLATLRPMLAQANELTLWRSDEITYQLYLHPLLPDDEACPGF